MNNILVADFSINDIARGAEIVDNNIITRTGYSFTHCRNLNTIEIDTSNFYLVSNFTGLSPEKKLQLARLGNYAIFEHDYKIHPTRQPNKFKDNIFPKNELINLPFYKKARAVFVQSRDHLECFNANNISANFVRLEGSIWSDEELDLLESLSKISKDSYKFCVIEDSSLDKGAGRALTFCKDHNIDFEILPKADKIEYIKNMSKYSALVYLPLVKESFCRLVVEARCLNMNVITNKEYGAVKEPWFNLSGKDMLNFLRESSRSNVETIKEICK